MEGLNFELSEGAIWQMSDDLNHTELILWGVGGSGSGKKWKIIFLTLPLGKYHFLNKNGYVGFSFQNTKRLICIRS